MIMKTMINRLDVIQSACLKNNNSFVLDRIGTSQIALHKDSDSPELRKCLIEAEKYIQSGTVIKDSRTTKAVLSELENGSKVFIKRYNNKGLKYTLKYVLRKARAFRAWRSAWSLEVCGIPTPKNMGVISFRKLGILKSAYLITECLENVIDVLDFYKIIIDNESLRNVYVDDVIRMLSILHQNGISHGDLKLSNIYIQKCGDDQYTFGLWDLDGTKYYGKELNDDQRRTELARLIASYIELGLRIDVKLDQSEIENMFLDSYSRYTQIGLKGKTLSNMVKRYVTKSHERIMRKKKKADK